VAGSVTSGFCVSNWLRSAGRFKLGSISGCGSVVVVVDGVVVVVDGVVVVL
jgi:hypothetical protein